MLSSTFIKLAALIVVGSVLTACGGGKSNGLGATEAAIRKVTTDYVAQSSSGEGDKAYALLSSAAQARCDKDRFKKASESVAASVKQSNKKVDVASIDGIAINGDTANARVSFTTAPGQPVEYQYAKEGGRWRLNPVSLTC